MTHLPVDAEHVVLAAPEKTHAAAGQARRVHRAVDRGRADPPAIVDGLMAGIREQVESGRAGRSLKAGDPAPAFTLPDASGTSFKSADRLGKGPLVVSFYRGVWCPYCNIELQALEEARGEIEKRGATVVAVSMQNAVNSRKSASDNKLGFPILIDAGGTVADAFGLRYRLSPETVELYKTLGNDLAVINGEPSWTLPMPGRYVIATDGAVAYAEVNPDYTKRPDPSDLLPILDQLARTRAT